MIRDLAHQREIADWHRQYEEKKRLCAESEKRRQAEIHKREMELQRCNALVKEASDWQNAKLIHNYLAHLDSTTHELGKTVPENSDFIR